MTDPVVREIRDLVNRALLPLKAVDEGLYTCAVGYVVEGTNPEVLRAVASFGDDPDKCLLPASPGASSPLFELEEERSARLQAVGITWTIEKYAGRSIVVLRDSLYRSNAVGSAQWVRLGRLLDAVLQTGASRGAPVPDSSDNSDKVPGWFGALLTDVVWTIERERLVGLAERLVEERPAWDARRLVSLLEGEGVEGADIPSILFLASYSDVTDRSSWVKHAAPADLPGVTEYLTRNASALPGSLMQALSLDEQRNVLRHMAASAPWAAAGAHLIAVLSVGTSKQLRRKAIDMLGDLEPAVRAEGLAPVLAKAPAYRSSELVEFLTSASGGDDLLVQAAAVNRKLADLITRTRARHHAISPGAEEPIELPPFPPLEMGPSAAPIKAELRPVLERMANRADGRRYSWIHGQMRELLEVMDDLLDALVSVADGKSDRPPVLLNLFNTFWFVQHAPSLTLAHALRLHAVEKRAWCWRTLEHYAGPRTDPRAIEDLMARLGLAADAAERLGGFHGYIFNAVDPEVSWPWYAEHLEVLRKSLTDTETAPRALEIIEAFPRIPAELLPVIAEIAVGSSKVNRPLAQAALRSHPRVRELAEQGLAARTVEGRVSAAAWVGSLGRAASVPAVRTALAKEKKEVVRAALLSALGRCGGDARELLSPEVLGAEAVKGLTGGIPASLTWFDMEALPAATWADGSRVDPRIIQWWVVLAEKLKNPSGRGLIDLYLSLLEPADAAALAAHVTRSWMVKDTHLPSAAHRRTYTSSAMADKGLLAFAVRMEGGELAGLVRSYMRDNPSRRAQFEALVHALHANSSPEALQVLLSIARRHKMSSVQRTAEALAQEVAEERGWSAEELADRTIPTAGFSDDGLLHVSYGPREFMGRLTPDFRIELADSAGKTLKSLPAARSGEDGDAVKAAKKQLTAARKEARAVLTLQSGRLYEAMCAGRTWPVPEWRRHLVAHPLVGRLVTRLVWLMIPADGGEQVAFRPAEDGALIGIDDAELDLSDDAAVALAHRTAVSADQAAAWQAHMADYEVTPLFDQLSATLPNTVRGQKVLTDLQGHVTDTLTLRGAATTRGYRRGAVMDGGTFDTYIKDFASANVTAVLSFTGSWVPEGNMACAIIGLSFACQGQEIELAAVPSVLLAECYADYKAMAALGPFDPQWQKNASPW